MELIFTLGFFAFASLACLWFSWRYLSRARIIEDTPTSNIRSAVQGYCELIGSIKRDQSLLLSPLSGSQCVWYSIKVEKYQRRGKNSHWQTIRKETSDTSFLLDDGSGVCHVHPSGALVSSKHRQVWRGSHSLAAGASIGSIGLVGMAAGNYRYSEQLLFEQDLIYAIGHFRTVDPLPLSAQIENHKLDLLAQWKRNPEMLKQRFDADGDGKIDQQEWQLARAEAEARAHALVLEEADYDVAHILEKPSDSRRHFILSNKDPKRLVKSLRYKAAALLAGFIVLVGFAAYLAQEGQLVF